MADSVCVSCERDWLIMQLPVESERAKVVDVCEVRRSELCRKCLNEICSAIRKHWTDVCRSVVERKSGFPKS
jgi:hypothetical protein